ncbi:hypothetical protein IQ22_00958 [Pseudomonas duriflava]|uniref:Uncharacterized protein n=1 Tax=Pseudomonas duriflava TaxID=459528 RepID=A0A562QIA8_9PSED|nr:hypothetical protein [Pseudomonas duriflava]TWI56508.1 hypothetical protein IQ22_00958 [Pseudomonas duriflava]
MLFRSSTETPCGITLLATTLQLLVTTQPVLVATRPVGVGQSIGYR